MAGQGGNYYSALALSLSTEDTSGVANSISNALSNSSDALDKAYTAGKEANDAFGNLLNTNGTSLGKVLDHYSTKEGKENIEANKADALEEATVANQMEEAKLLAEYNAKQNAYIDDKTKQLVGRDYAGMRNDLDAIIKSKTNGRLDFEKYMFYLNKPDLIQQAQQFRNYYGNVQKTLNEKGELIYPPIDLTILGDLETLEKDHNMTHWTSRMRYIESEKDRIKRGVITEPEYHDIYKKSMDNAYKVTKNYNEATFKETMNIEDRATIYTKWANNFNAGVPPALWKDDVVVASKQVEEQVSKNISSSDNLKNKGVPSTISDEQEEYTITDATGIDNNYDKEALEALEAQSKEIEEKLNSPEIKKEQEVINKQINEFGNMSNDQIRYVSQTGNLDVFDDPNGTNSGYVNAFTEAMKYQVKSLFPAGSFIVDNYYLFELAVMGKLGLNEVSDSLSDETKGKIKEGFDKAKEKLGIKEKEAIEQAEKEIDKQAGVNENDTEDEKKKKRNKWWNGFKNGAKSIAGWGIKGVGKTLGRAGAVVVAGTVLTTAGETENHIRDGLGVSNREGGALAPKDEHEARMYNKMFFGEKPSDWLGLKSLQLQRWDINNVATYIREDIEDLETTYSFLKMKHDEGVKSSSLLGKLWDWSGDKNRYAKDQVKAAMDIVQGLIIAKRYQDKSLQTAKIKNFEEQNIIRNTSENLKANISYKDALKQEANAENGEGSGENLAELKQQSLEAGAKATDNQKRELASLYSNGMENAPEHHRDDQTKYSINSISNLNDQTKASFQQKNVKTENMSRSTAVVQSVTRGLIYDNTHGTQNKAIIEKISKDENVMKAVDDLENVIMSDNYKGKITRNGALVGAYNKLVVAISESLDKNGMLKATIDLPDGDKSDFAKFDKENRGSVYDKALHMVGQRFITNRDFSSKIAFQVSKFFAYQSSVKDPKLLDFSNNDNWRRLQKTKFNDYIYLGDAKQTKEFVNRDANKNDKSYTSQQSKYENVINKHTNAEKPIVPPKKEESKNKPNEVYKGKYINVTKNGKAVDISTKMSKTLENKEKVEKEVKNELEHLLNNNIISKKAYDDLVKSLNIKK